MEARGMVNANAFVRSSDDKRFRLTTDAMGTLIPRPIDLRMYINKPVTITYASERVPWLYGVTQVCVAY
jgi:hypothetical protein